MCLQFFVGAAFAYNGLDEYTYANYIMQIPEQEYYRYVFPAVCAFIFGLHITAGNYKGEIVNKKSIEQFIDKNIRLPYFFIVVGFCSSFFAGFFPSELAFFFYLIAGLKFVGLFMLVLGSRQIKIVPMIVVIGSILLSSLNSGMFHDLLTWVIFTIAIFAIKYKFGLKAKLIGLGVFITLVTILQVLKGGYREATSIGGQEKGLETFTELFKQTSETTNFFGLENLAGSNVRINQGFIITNIMKTVPEVEPFANGSQLKIILEAAILPRILAPNKLRAGDRSIFVKYSHIPITSGTSMGLSSIGDAYINFGIVGGIVFMFLYGLLFSEVLNGFYRYSRKYPILILLVPLAFYYPIRPDCELQTILGHLVKCVFFIFLILLVWKNHFRISNWQTNMIKSIQKST